LLLQQLAGGLLANIGGRVEDDFKLLRHQHADAKIN
jgi:hypothetical protein